MTAWTEQRPFRTLLAADPAVEAHLSPQELQRMFDLDYHLKYVDLAFDRAGLRPRTAAQEDQR
jgi:adenylosuccinate lyase